ncbi:MAG: hypothetical protein ACREL5_12760 [Gemmatimonadales bacterium]
MTQATLAPMRRASCGRPACAVASLLLLLALPLAAQTMRDRVKMLFEFTPGCAEPLCLVGANNAAHAGHFIASADSVQGNMIEFLANAIGTSASDVPLSSASSSTTFGTSASGLFVQTRTSAGPIFAERAQTIGKGRVLVGANFSSYSFQSLRGVPLNDLRFTFTHARTTSAPLGQGPAFENDVIEVATAVAVQFTQATAFATWGVIRNLDLSVSVPVVHLSMSGTSFAQLMPFGANTPHYFGSTADPSLNATAASSGSASGIGDVAARVKAVIANHGRSSLAVVGDVRLPSGDADNFLGTGSTSFRALAIGSARYGTFSPHLNLGYWGRSTATLSNALLATAGFDNLIGDRVTFAADLISEWQVGPNKLAQAQPVVIETTVTDSDGTYIRPRTITPSNIPSRRDNEMLSSLGFKYAAPGGMTLVTNVLIPVLRGGLQPSVSWTLGAEYIF